MPQSSVRVTLNGHEVSVPRARLGVFLRLERYLNDLKQGINERHSGKIVTAIYLYIHEITGEDIDFKNKSWLEVVEVFLRLRSLNSLHIDLPMLKYPPTGGENKPVPWDYPERSFFMWTHTLAYNYGWALSEIEQLWPEEAAAYVQEIATEEQLKKEWEHMLSPVTHGVNKQNKPTYQRLMRPGWMASRPRKMKILKEALPVGTIINVSGIDPEDLDD